MQNIPSVPTCILARIQQGGRIAHIAVRGGDDRKTIVGKQHRDTGRIAIRNLDSEAFALITTGTKPELDDAITQREHRIIGAILPNN